MLTKSVAALAAVLLTGGSTVALAQTGYGGNPSGMGPQNGQYGNEAPYPNQGYGRPDLNRNQYNRNWSPGPLSPAARDGGYGQFPYNRYWPPGPVNPAARNEGNPAQTFGQNTFRDRAALRRTLRQMGFRNIRILNAETIVQAMTPSGRWTTMVVNPSDLNASAGPNRSGSSQPSARSGQSGQAAQGSSNRSSAAGVGGSQNTPAIMTPGLLDEDQVRSHMESIGFSDISDMTKDGNTYTGKADWYGEQVDFRVDARNGYVIDPDHLKPDQVETMLNDEGWDDIGDINLQGTSYHVQASQNGTPYDLWINARTGQIDRQTASNTSGSSGGSADSQGTTTQQ